MILKKPQSQPIGFFCSDNSSGFNGHSEGKKCARNGYVKHSLLDLRLRFKTEIVMSSKCGSIRIVFPFPLYCNARTQNINSILHCVLTPTSSLFHMIVVQAKTVNPKLDYCSIHI